MKAPSLRRCITIHRSSWASISNPPEGCLRLTCAAFDPAAPYNFAFKQGRWDGIKELFTSAGEFPVGLVEKVKAWLEEQGYEVTIQQPAFETVDPDRFTAAYLAGIELYDHQMGALQALWNQPRGVIRAGTGSGKTEIVCAGARFFLEEKNWRSLIIVPKVGLAHQTRERLQKYYGPELPVGLMADQQRIPGQIVVATAATMLAAWPREKKGKRGITRYPADPMVKETLRDSEVLWLDECHHSSAEGWYECAMASKAKRKYGLSGTPLKDEALADLRMTAATGPILYEVQTTSLVDKGLLARPHIVMVMSENASGPTLPSSWGSRMVKGKIQRYAKHLPYAEAYLKGIVENPHHNTAVIRAALWLMDRKKRTLILTRRKSHFLDLKARLDAAGVESLAVWGASDKYLRDRAKKLLNEGKVHCVLASTIWDEGEDVPGIDALVLAEGVKVSTNSLQRIGRSMRKKAGENVAWVVDFVPTNHPKLTEHALERCESYEGEGYEVELLESWPADGDAEFDEGALLPFRVAS